MSVPEVRNVRLELVRPGKPHNQLLSPLTPYMALCGEGSPITFHIELEHHQLLTRLERLRYVTASADRFVGIPERLRQAEVAELGAEVARILAEIQTLSTELARAQGDGAPGASEAIVHLRLVLAGSELSLIPFEMAIAPLAYPGEGLEFCLQASLPIVVTREIRRGRPVPATWNRSSRTAPKVLVVWAEPEGMRVPAEQHVRVIRAALEPWVRRVPEPAASGDAEARARARLPHVKARLRLLPNASVEAVYRACAAEDFTHVHILAHGDTFQQAGETRFGVALCRDDGSGEKEVVSGQRLAKALQAEDKRGASRSHPLVVTLATCDSGNQMSVLVPGGSIAHDLHSEGIPWVFASQFPLTVPGSVRMAEGLYGRLLRGDDPRQVLFELRRQLYLSAKGDHDWASIVAYATLGSGFAGEVTAFSSRQIKEAIKVSLEHADSVVSSGAASGAQPGKEQVARAATEVEKFLKLWMARAPKGKSAEERLARSEVVNMHGSTYKRLALLHAAVGDREDALRYYARSLEAYRETMSETAAANQQYYWSATQYLSLRAIRDEGPDLAAYELARRLAERDLVAAGDDGGKAWAHATLAELELLAVYHAAARGARRAGGAGRTDKEACRRVEEHCKAIVAQAGPKSFYVASTLRQFKRYAEQWQSEKWRAIAERAIHALTPFGEPPDFDYPED